jgi:hypothetical protein
MTQPGWLAATVKSQAVCVHGADVSPHLAGVRPGIDLVFEGWNLPRNVAIAGRLQDISFASDKAAEARVWASKKVVRSAFELVMKKADCFTRDLVACHELFQQHRPEKSEHLAEALALALHHEGDAGQFDRVVNFAKNYLYPEICREYGAERMAQLLIQMADEE